MLQDIRQQVQGTTAKIVVGVIVISFAFFGIESILVNGGGNEIAEVNGEPVYPQELQQALDTQKRRLIAMMGQNLDPAMLDDEQLRPQALDALINRTLLMQSAEALNLAISEPEIGTVVGSMEQFQVDGAFSPELYKSVLANAGYTPSYFKASLRDDMLLNQLRSGIAGSEFITGTELELNARVISEQRDLRYFVIPRQNFSTILPISDAQIEAYYAAHEVDFRTPESLDIDYLELTLDDFRQPVEESAILEAFELAKQENQFQTQNRVSHILFEPGDEIVLEQRIAEAREKLAAGVPFVDVAREYSEDVGSAEKGGDLGYSSGHTFPEAMETAISQLEPGVVSGPVQTEAGTHLILVTERKQGDAPNLEDMHDQLEKNLQTDDARVALLRSVESLRDLSFNAEDLGYPSTELDIPVKSENAVTRTHKEGLFSNPAVLEAAFSEDVLSLGNNSEVIELEGDRFVVLHVRHHNLPEAKPLASVRNEVLAAVTEEISRAAVVSAANQALEQIRSGLTMDEYAKENGYAIQVELAVDRRNASVPPDILRRVFELPSPGADSSSSDFVISPNGDAVFIELQQVKAGEYKSLIAGEQLQLQQLLTSEFGSLINNEFQRGLRERAEIKVL
jgi:peptidyl-prolyl cis-trans isomerase D